LNRTGVVNPKDAPPHLTSTPPHLTRQKKQHKTPAKLHICIIMKPTNRAEQNKHRKASQTSPEAICNHTIQQVSPSPLPKPGLTITLDRTPLVENRREASPSRLQIASGLADTNNNNGGQTQTTTMADKTKEQGIWA
jgi:hypothetical protein